MGRPEVTREVAIAEGWYDPNTNGGYCMCGCGELTAIADRSQRGDRLVKGEPKKFVGRHGTRLAAVGGWYKPNVNGGLCHCGCGAETKLATATSREQGTLAGQPLRFLRGHGGPRGESHYLWKGGRTVTPDGYVMVAVPGHPAAQKSGNYVAEHRLVMERHIGRLLRPEESVHHINGNRADNRIENLELWASSHPSGQRVTDLLAWAREIEERYGCLSSNS